jgi:DNA replication and repair protein RecF
MRDIVGKVPSISFAPDDQGLVSGDPGARRSFLDQAAALLDPRYTTICAEFNKVAKQRVALLKQLGAQQESVDARQMALSGLEVWTGQFIEAGVRLTRARNELVSRLTHRFNGIYERLSGKDQQAGLAYEPSFDEVLQFERPESEISKHFERLYAGEVARGRNLIGPHRDDLIISLNGVPAKEFASNGEMWTLALALKMALYDEVSSISGNKPIIILDDVFAQLDDMRRSQILDFALAQDQVVLTVAALGDVPARVMNDDTVNVIDVARLKAAAVDANEVLVAELRNTMFGAVDGNAAETVRDQASDLKARTTSGGRSLGGGAAGVDFELTENSSGTVGEVQSDGADGMEGARPNIDGESAERSTGDGAE